MKVILLQDIKSVGKKGDIVEASDGYARNYLMPKKLAKEASAANVNQAKKDQETAAHRTAPVLRCGRQALRQNPQNPRQGGDSAG